MLSLVFTPSGCIDLQRRANPSSVCKPLLLSAMSVEGSSSTAQHSSAAPVSSATQDVANLQQDQGPPISPAKDAPHLRFEDTSQQPSGEQGHLKSDKPAAAEGATAGMHHGCNLRKKLENRPDLCQNVAEQAWLQVCHKHRPPQRCMLGCTSTKPHQPTSCPADRPVVKEERRDSGLKEERTHSGLKEERTKEERAHSIPKEEHRPSGEHHGHHAKEGLAAEGPRQLAGTPTRLLDREGSAKFAAPRQGSAPCLA